MILSIAPPVGGNEPSCFQPHGFFWRLIKALRGAAKALVKDAARSPD